MRDEKFSEKQETEISEFLKYYSGKSDNEIIAIAIANIHKRLLKVEESMREATERVRS